LGNHGGKRDGAGRQPKWDFFTKVKIGQECEALQKKEELKIFNNNALKDVSDLNYLWENASQIDINDRSDWLISEDGEQHLLDIQEELVTLNLIEGNPKLKNRLFKIPKNAPKGTRQAICKTIAEKYSLNAKQVDNIWQFYRRFERSTDSGT
jgi:hypothetical protein